MIRSKNTLFHEAGNISVASEHLLKADDLSARHRKGLERIHRAASRMSRMIADLIDFARRLGRHVPINRQATDFAEVCRRVVDEVRRASSTQVELKVQGNVQGAWDPERLGQAVSNLLNNAVQHGAPPFEIAVSDAGNDVLLEVSNYGQPIASDATEFVFEPFGQKTSTDGLGLGLFIVSEIVVAHGGRIEVKSDPDGKTVFISRWPRSQGSAR